MGEELPSAKIRILGTSHISSRSAEEIKKAFAEFQPDIVAVELDQRRLHALLNQEKRSVPLSMIRHVGVAGWLFLLIGGFVQKKLAGIVNVQPGVDMLAAVTIAREHNKMLLLVDQDVLVTMKKLSKAFTFREKTRMLWDVLSSPFRKEKIRIRLDRVPSAATIRKLMGVLQERYPGLHKVLVTDRNVVMAARLDKTLRGQPGKSVLLVVGAGHEEDLRERLAHSPMWDVV